MRAIIGALLSELQATKVGDHPIFFHFLGFWPPAQPQNEGKKIEKIDFSGKVCKCMVLVPSDFKLLLEKF